MKQLLAQAWAANWITEPIDCPISNADDIFSATENMGWGELIIIDLHGWTDHYGVTGAYLSPSTADGWASLSHIESRSWRPAAMILTNCRGVREEFLAELRRIIAARCTVTGHFDQSDLRDETPVDVVRAILEVASGGDESEAHDAADRAVYWKLRNSPPWLVEKYDMGKWAPVWISPIS